MAIFFKYLPYIQYQKTQGLAALDGPWIVIFDLNGISCAVTPLPIANRVISQKSNTVLISMTRYFFMSICITTDLWSLASILLFYLRNKLKFDIISTYNIHCSGH